MGMRAKLTDDFKAQGDSQVRRLGAALYAEGNEIMADAKGRYVPVESGKLRASGRVRQTNPGGKPEVELTFGEPGSGAEKYARVVHERPASVGQGKNKYLEKPMLAAMRGFSQRIARRMK